MNLKRKSWRIVFCFVLLICASEFDLTAGFQKEKSHANITLPHSPGLRQTKQNDASCPLPPNYNHQNHSVHCPNTTNSCSHKAGEHVPAFTQIVVECSAGYQLIHGNTSVSSCFQGAWEPPIPICCRTCPIITNPNLNLTCLQKLGGVSIPCNGTMLEDAVVYPKCKDYYHADRKVNYAYIKCQSNGEWDQQLFKCIPDCGRTQSTSRTLVIYGGKPGKRGDSPWHVAIYDISKPKNPDLICGGTIIAPQIIVSAAHCFFDFAFGSFRNSSSFEVVVAKYTRNYTVNDSSQTKAYKIRKIFTSEIYPFTGESTNYVGDIALIWISGKIEFSNEILPACVNWTHTTPFIVPDGTEGKLVGWGKTENEPESNVLQEASLPYHNYSSCRQMVSEDFSIAADKFCAGSKRGVGVGQGDSGGGLLFRNTSVHDNLYYLRGIVSNKDPLIGKKRTLIATFTDVAQYVGWIHYKRTEIENNELGNDENLIRSRCEKATCSPRH